MSFRLRILLVAAAIAPPAYAVDEVPPAVLQGEQTRIEAVAKATKSAVAVFADGGTNGGSGVVISKDGFALTNFHVAKPAGSYMQCGMADGRLYDAVIVGIDPTGDAALIKLLGRDDFPAAELADSDAVRVGDWCFAIGNPFLLATDFKPTVTFGIVSGTHRYQYPAGTLLEYADCIQTDAAINPGNSGGPLFNARGELIGVNGRGSFEKRGRVNVGVGYAISINQLKHFLGPLHSGRIVDHATLGASVSTSDDGKVVVSNILENSDAYRRGLRYGDEIVAFGGREIRTTNAYKNVLGIFPKGMRVPLTYRRDGTKHDVLVKLTGVHTEEELIRLIQRAPVPESPQPQPDGKQPEPKKPEKAPPKNPPKKPAGGKEAVALPPEVAKLIEDREGFANYYFNRLHQERLAQAIARDTDASVAAKVWKLKGELAGGGTFSVMLGDERSEGEFPAGKVVVDASKDLDEQLGPKGSGGLLLALHLWRRMVVQGPAKFGNTVYYGTTPHSRVPGGDSDVLTSYYNVVESQFYISPAGRLTLVEVAPGDDDPCELRLIDPVVRDGVLLPQKIEARLGDLITAELSIQEVAFTAPDKP